MNTNGYEDETEMFATQPLPATGEFPADGEGLKKLVEDGVYATYRSRHFGGILGLLERAHAQATPAPDGTGTQLTDQEQ